MRIFVGLDIDAEIRGRIAEFIQEVRGSAPEVRWVEPEALHVTLKFIGEKPDAAVADMEKTLAGVTTQSFELSFRGYGFFPTEKAARVFWVGIEADAKLAELAGTIEETLAGMGIPKEERGFSPHLTLARGGARIGSGSGAPGRRTGDRINQRFARLQQRLARRLPDGRLSKDGLSEDRAQCASLEFGTMAAHEFFLYRSELSAKGSQYTKIARFGLK